ncbi:glycosyltransferase involved in cell wall biosynthesis [Mycobacterium sp. BK558]|nr:glycosyltransferase involved in cell wall biosynthesis [Mycobacterium sp. BK558]
MRLLQIAGTLNPEYGGPPVVVAQLSRNLSQLGHTVDVATLDSPADRWLEKLPGRVEALGPAANTYGYSLRLKRWLIGNASAYDAVVVHGIWRYESRVVRQVCARRGIPYFVFVHGALDPWFKKRYPKKHVKKWVYWQLSEYWSLKAAAAVLYTQELERQLAKESFRPFNFREAVLPLGIDEPPGSAGAQRQGFFATYPALADKRIILFLGRLHPKKGCDILLKSFSAVASLDPTAHLVVAGPDDGSTLQNLKALSRELDIQDRISWLGMLTGDLKWGAYHSADVFALTSHSENFGIVLAEALACGLPVLTTDKVNIWCEIQESGGGLIGSDTVLSGESLLRQWLTMSTGDRDRMRRLARGCFERNFSAARSAEEFARFVVDAIDR